MGEKNKNKELDEVDAGVEPASTECRLYDF